MKYKALDILRTFTDNELNECRLFLSSRLLNRSEKTAKLFDALLEFAPGYEAAILTEIYLNKKVSPHLEFNKSSMKNLFADLAELLEDFIIYKNFSKRKFDRLDILREEYLRRNLYKYSERLINQSKKLLNEPGSLSSSYFDNYFRLNTDELNLLNTSKPKNGSEYVVSFRKLSDERAMNLTGLFLKEQIKIYENFQTINRTFNLKDNSKFMIELFETVDFERLNEFMLKNSPDGKGKIMLEMYSALYKCFLKLDNERYFEKYKKLVFRNDGQVDRDEIRFHLINIVKYCMRKNDNASSEKKFEKQLFDVYKYILEKGYYNTNLMSYMPNEFFRTALLQSLKLKEFKFAKELIQNYSHELHPERRISMELFANALYDFHTGKYEKALETCSKIKLDHFVLKFDVKNLMLMINVELGRTEACRQIIDSYRHTLTKDKVISSEERNRHLNFVRAVSKLLAMNTSKRESHEFEIRLIMKKNLPNREWVEEKLNERKISRKTMRNN